MKKQKKPGWAVQSTSVRDCTSVTGVEGAPPPEGPLGPAGNCPALKSSAFSEWFLTVLVVIELATRSLPFSDLFLTSRLLIELFLISLDPTLLSCRDTAATELPPRATNTAIVAITLAQVRRERSVGEQVRGPCGLVAPPHLRTGPSASARTPIGRGDPSRLDQAAPDRVAGQLHPVP